MILEKDWLGLSKEELIRMVVGYQWQIAMCVSMNAKPKYSYSAYVMDAWMPTAQEYVESWISLKRKYDNES